MFVGIDIGTSEVKAVLLSERHALIASTSASLSISRPLPGHSEQNPEDWWTACCVALQKLNAAVPLAYAKVMGLGLSGQMHGAVLLDEKDQILCPAMLWNDTRASQECSDMMAQLPQMPQLAGSLAMPGFTAPKLRWIAKHQPGIFAKTAKVLLPKDYVRLRLTGEAVTDMSDASGTAWLDVEQRDWSDDLLKLTGMARQHMPRLVEGSAQSSVVSASAATLLGLKPGIVVAGGGGDNAASAVGMGAVEPGQGFLSLGTSGVLFVVTPSFQPNAASATHAFCHAVPNRWHQMSVMLSAASCLQWASGLLGVASAAELESKASRLNTAQRATAPLFLPYLSGERTPHNSAQVRGSFHGLGHDTDAASLAYAVMEGVSFGLNDGLAALQAAGVQTQRLSLVGGGARSTFWAQQLASLLNIEILTHKGSEAGGALGAARLGWLAAGGILSDVCVTPEVAHVYTPQLSERSYLYPRYQQFKSLYKVNP